MNNKTLSIAVALGGFLGIIHATLIEPSTFGIYFAGTYTLIGFWSWIEIEKNDRNHDKGVMEKMSGIVSPEEFKKLDKKRQDAITAK